MSTNIKKTEKRNKEFNHAAYWQDFSISNALWLTGLSLVFILFSDVFIQLWNFVAIQPLLKHCLKDNLLTDIVFLTYFACGIGVLAYQIHRGLFISLNSLLFITVFLLLYFFIVRNNPTNDFYFFKLSWLSDKAYATCFVISTPLFLATYKSYYKPISIPRSNLSLIDDSSSLSGYEDAYSRTGYAKSIAEHISQTSTASSFAIAVVGEWGSGKTDFLLRLKSELDNENNLVFDFNPWRVKKTDAIIEEFFKTLSDKLKPFNQSIHSKLKEYSRRILQTGKEVYFRFFDTLINEWTSDDSIEKQYEEINKAISGLSKRVIIFIDDMDRLTGKEIMEVLRIIRNTANFANTFFIVAIDQKYVVNVLKGTKDFSNEEEYLKKVFQLIITLPAFKKDIFTELIKEYLLTDDLEAGEKTAINEAIAKITTDFGDLSIPYYPAANHDDILEKMVDNSRDLKRFCNSFKIAYNNLKGEIDIHDLMVLELIRNRNVEVYNLVRNRYFLDFDVNHTDQFKLNNSRWEEFQKEYSAALSTDEINNLKTAVDYLITDVGYKNARKFKDVHNFYLYFSYQLFNLISLKSFNEILEKDHQQITTQFDSWYAEKKGAELIHIISTIVDFKNAAGLEKMIVAYLNVKTDHAFWMGLAGRLLFTLKDFNEDKYFENDADKHAAFLRTLMKNANIAAFDRAQMAAQFLNAAIQENRSNSILTKVEWQEIILTLFTEFLSNSNLIKSYNSMMSFYYANRLEIDGKNRVILNPKASELFKNFLTNNRGAFSIYVKHLIRPLMQPYEKGSLLVFEPFLEQTFENWMFFKEELQNQIFQDKDTQEIQRIALEHIDNYYLDPHREGFVLNEEKDEKLVAGMLAKLSIGS